MNTLKLSNSDDMDMTGISSVPFPPKLPFHSLPRGAKAIREIGRASYIISWKSVLFFALAAAVFMAILYFI